VRQLRDAMTLIAAELAAILDGLSALAWRHRDTPCVGRTYGQHAAPLTFGTKAAIWLAGVAETAERLPEVRTRRLVAALAGPGARSRCWARRGQRCWKASRENLAWAPPPSPGMSAARAWPRRRAGSRR
jgi:adenylosuccinate lyase